jgi:hypothetical protein
MSNTKSRLFSAEAETSLMSMELPIRRIVVGTLLLYVFRGINQSEIRQNFRRLSVEFDFLSWRRRLHTNGLLLREAKIWVYSRFLDPTFASKGFGLSIREGNLLKLSLEFKPLRSRLQVLHKKEARDPLSISQVENFCGEVLASRDYLVYVRKYLYKKMGFLVNSYGVTYKELESDLISWSLYALLRAYPRFDDVGHGIAIAKTVAKRRGVNLMKAMTAQKNNQLITDKNGACQQVSIPLSSILDGSGQFLSEDSTFVHRSFLVVGINGLSQAAEGVGWETLQSIKSLKTSSKFTETQRRFLHLMLGEPDADFSSELGVPNDEYIHKVPYTLYKDKVCEYMALRPELADRFLQNLKPHLGDSAR